MSNQIKAYGKVEGELLIYELEKFNKALVTNLEGCGVEIIIKKKSKPRTHPQLKYYFGVVVDMIRDRLHELDGKWYDPDDVHTMLKSKFNGQHIITAKGQYITVPVSTEELGTYDFVEKYIEEIRHWALEVLEIDIPHVSEGQKLT